MKKIFSLVMGLSLVGCGGSDSSSNSQSVSASTHYQLRYDLTENNCQTCRHEFDSLDHYCQGLRDDSLNHGCAGSLREALYQKSCAQYGQFDSSFEKPRRGAYPHVYHCDQGEFVTGRFPDVNLVPPPAPIPELIPAPLARPRELEINIKARSFNSFLSEKEASNGSLQYQLTMDLKLERGQNRTYALQDSGVEIVTPEKDGCVLNTESFTDTDARGQSRLKISARDLRTEHACQKFLQSLHDHGGIFRFLTETGEQITLEIRP